ncbi:MAG: mRNA surveillance protein pelota [Candidatus Bathycorpusculaceae bacterium]
MKILEKNLKKNFVKVIPESLDDLWHLYNVIYKGDEVYAYTSREIKPDEKYSRPKRGERVSVFLGIKVEDVGWDKLLGRLRVHGIICDAPEIIPTGAHHTLNIALDSPLTIVKREWAKHNVERLERACRMSEKPLLIVAIDDEGYVIATTAQYGVDIRVEEGVRLPGKLEAEKRDAAVHEFFKKALNSMRQFWTAARLPVVIVGVGFVKNHFVKFLENEAAEISRSVIDVKSINNSGVAGVYEALRSGVLVKAARRLRIAEETEILEEIMRRLGKGEGTVAYGVDEVGRAAKIGTVERLVLADVMLRESTDEKRLLIENIMMEVERKGGSTMVFSTEHEAGTKLLSLSGIAAILRYPVHQSP